MLRHVSPAFAEDPVRILRVARFAARFGFDIAPETACADARDGRRAAKPTRWCPSAYGRSLRAGSWKSGPRACSTCCTRCGALARVAPEIAALFEDRGAAQAALDALLDAAAEADARWRCASRRSRAHSIRYAVEALAQPAQAAGARAATSRCSPRGMRIRSPMRRSSTPEALLELLDATDAWRRPERFESCFAAAFAGEREAAAAHSVSSARRPLRSMNAGERTRERRVAKDDSQNACAPRGYDAIRTSAGSVTGVTSD